MREKGRKKKKGRTWAEAARTVLEKNPNTPMSHKEILHVIQKEGLKEINGTSPLACLNAMLHTNSRGEEGIFYKVPGRMGVYTLKKDVPDGLKELSEGSEESSDGRSDSPTSENSSSGSSSGGGSSSSSSGGGGDGDRSGNKEGQKNRWRRKVTTRLSQGSSPQPGCPSPSLPAGKVLSSSQKHSKKALKQALKQKQRKQQQCRASGPVSSNHHHLQQHAKATGHTLAPSKPAWEGKHPEGPSSSPPTSTSSSSPSVKAEPSLPVLGKKPFPRSERLHARQLKRTKCAEIDVETPDSILVNTNLRALINKHTFSLLPVEGQQRLLLLLPEVDRQAGVDGLLKLTSSALNNEFFTSAAQGWKERLSEGEFTPEMQLRLRQELEKEKKTEPWKEHFFESYYGQSSGLSPEESRLLTSSPTRAPREALLQKCLPASSAVTPGEGEAVPPALVAKDLDLSACKAAAAPGKEEAAPPAPSLTAPAAPSRVEEEKTQPPATECGGARSSRSSSGSLPSQFGSQAPCRPPSLGEQDESRGAGPREEAPALGSESACKPKSPPASPGPDPQPEKEAQGRPPTGESSAATLEPMDAAGGHALKRRAGATEEGLATPEKRPLLAEKSPSRPPFQAPPQHFPTAPVPKVPPLRIPVSRIHRGLAPFPASQGPPGPSLPLALGSPRRTGARTLADIKARAQMARAQRAAAAAAAAASLPAASASGVGAIPGPGPGGGRAEERSRLPPGGPPGAPLDLATPGSRAGPGRPWPPAPGPWPPPESPAPGGAARAQLQPPSPAQPRTPAPAPAPAAEAPPTAQPTVRVDASQVDPGLSRLPAIPLGLRGPPLSSMPRPEGSGKVSASAGQASGLVAPSRDGSGPISGSSSPSSLPPISQASSSESFKTPPPPPPPPVTPGGPAVSSGPLPTAPAGLQQMSSPSVASKGPAVPIRSSSSRIPANNPLVAQLLQGKEVPLEQILPKPLLLRVEMKAVPLPAATEGQEPWPLPSRDLTQGLPPLLSFPPGEKTPGFPQGSRPTPGPAPGPSSSRPDPWGASAGPGSGQEPSVPSAREQLCHGLLQRGAPQGLPLGPSPPPHPLPSSQSFVLGFAGRRTSKPAMSGHYLLNISTYGRCPENLRRSLAMPPPEHARLCPEGFDKEGEEEEEEEEEEEPIGGGSSPHASDQEEEEEEEGVVLPREAGHPAALEVMMPEESRACERGAAREQAIPRPSAKKGELVTGSQKEGSRLILEVDPAESAVAAARDLLQAAQAHVAQAVQGERRPRSTELYPGAPGCEALPRPQLFSPSHPARFFGGPGAAPQLVGTGYSGTINVSTSPDLHQEALLTGLSDPSRMGDMVSFSVTVTTIPGGQAGGAGLFGRWGLEDLPSKCYCRLKAMIVCKGCGAFCHDDCIGPSKLCVACLVVR
ncbi:hypothetical protein JRQ81_005471 [Phrynocephalus forsythii]|uniref:Polycomb group protein ASXL2 n=1 Tax=Phrynocephalus forsythii TaxID=171643 RepID=A0A9Q1B6V1_9SAUR|nr:hypothetical protein JRQ81_005471 [Phrynocephalus forsythii]